MKESLANLKNSFQISTSRPIRIGMALSGMILIREISLLSNGLTDGPILCPIRFFIGMPCPSCGTTRSVGAISEGRFADALNFNPLGYVVVLALLSWVLRYKNISRFEAMLKKSFLNLPVKTRISTLSALFLLAWIANILRIDSAIF